MLTFSYAGCPGLFLVILMQFALKICVAAKNHQKSIRNPIVAFKVIQSRCFRCQSKASVRLPIKD